MSASVNLSPTALSTTSTAPGQRRIPTSSDGPDGVDLEDIILESVASVPPIPCGWRPPPALLQGYEPVYRTTKESATIGIRVCSRKPE